VFDLPEDVLLARHAARTHRAFSARGIREHRDLLHQSIDRLRRECFDPVHVLRSAETVAAAEVVRAALG
jgi:hypothetical protein